MPAKKKSEAIDVEDQEEQKLKTLVTAQVQVAVADALGEAMKPILEHMRSLDQPKPQVPDSKANSVSLLELKQAVKEALAAEKNKSKGPQAIDLPDSPSEEDEDEIQESTFTVPSSDRIAKMTLARAGRFPSVTAWIRSIQVWDARSLKEVLQWAELIDAFVTEELPLDSMVLEIAFRRIEGVRLACQYSNWELADQMQFGSLDSLISPKKLAQVVKQANAVAALSKRASGGGHSGHAFPGRGGHGGHGGRSFRSEGSVKGAKSA